MVRCVLLLAAGTTKVKQFRFSGTPPLIPNILRSTAASDSTIQKAQMHFCSDAQMPRSVDTALAVLTDRVHSKAPYLTRMMNLAGKASAAPMSGRLPCLRGQP